jgi:Raf kinase inhibitor-like YbhB/YbcL family protein
LKKGQPFHGGTPAPVRIFRLRSNGTNRRRAPAVSRFSARNPDAPGGTFRHWAIFDIPLERRRLAEGLRPVATVEGMCQATNDFGRLGYAGPCPPRGHGNHHYHFRLLALDVDRLSVDPQMSCGMVEAEARGHVLAAAELVGLFRR